jgi:hypothetical protein
VEYVLYDMEMNISLGLFSYLRTNRNFLRQSLGVCLSHPRSLKIPPRFSRHHYGVIISYASIFSKVSVMYREPFRSHSCRRVSSFLAISSPPSPTFSNMEHLERYVPLVRGPYDHEHNRSDRRYESQDATFPMAGLVVVYCEQ